MVLADGTTIQKTQTIYKRKKKITNVYRISIYEIRKWLENGILFCGFFFLSSLPHFFLPAKLFLAKKIIIIQKKAY